MSKVFLSILLALLVAGCAPRNAIAQIDEGIQHARSGDLACILPASNKKSCNELIQFQFATAGEVTVIAQATMQADPPIVMSARYSAMLDGDSICGGPTADDVTHASFAIGGQPASDVDTSNLRAHIVENMQAHPQGNACVRFEHTAAQWYLRVTMNGIRHPDLDSSVRWVRSDQSYSVGP